MALGTIGRQPHVNPAHGLHAVGGVVGEVFFVDGAALIRGDVAALKSSSDQLILAWVWQ